MKSSRLFRLFWLLSIVFCAVLVTDVVPWLRGDVPWMPHNGKWIWPYGHPRWLYLIPCVLALGIYVWGAVRLLDDSPTARYPVRLILWAFVGSALLPLLLLTLEGRPLFLLFTRAASPHTGGYQHAAATVTNLRETLLHWPQFTADYRAQYRLHPGGVVLDPPGWLAVYYANVKLFQAVPFLADRFGSLVRPLECQNLAMMTWTNAQMASAWFQMLMPIWAALAVAPLYRLGTLLLDRERARLAVVLWPLVPGMVIFQPRFNVFYPLITLVMLITLWRGLTRNKKRWIVVSGGIVSVGTFLNLSLVPLGLLAGLVIAGYRLLVQRGAIRRLARDLVLFGIASVSVWGMYWLLSGLSPFEIIDAALNRHYQMNRPYFPWLIMHPYDMFLFVGVPLAFFAVWRIGRLRVRRAVGPADLLTGASALTLVILVLSGTARGETGRVWLFFAPVWILLAVDVLVSLGRRERIRFLSLQAVCVLSMAAVLRANFTALTVPPDPPSPKQAAAYSYDVQFKRGDETITFVGLSLEATPTQVTFHLYWRADTFIHRPYVLSLVSVPPDQSAFPSTTWDPENWNYPPSCWSPGHEFVDTVTIPLGDSPRPGDWLFSLSILDAFSHEPVWAVGPDGQPTTQIGIGPVHVPESAVQ